MTIDQAKNKYRLSQEQVMPEREWVVCYYHPAFDYMIIFNVPGREHGIPQVTLDNLLKNVKQ